MDSIATSSAIILPKLLGGFTALETKYKVRFHSEKLQI